MPSMVRDSSDKQKTKEVLSTKCMKISQKCGIPQNIGLASYRVLGKQRKGIISK